MYIKLVIFVNNDILSIDDTFMKKMRLHIIKILQNLLKIVGNTKRIPHKYEQTCKKKNDIMRDVKDY